MNKFSFILKKIAANKSLLRAYLDFSLHGVTLKGKTIDVGGGHGDEYLSFVARAENTVFETFDLKVGKQVDFEKDPLPAPDCSYDTVVFINVMEHIYNYQHIANEVVRITKTGGQLIGYVPFLMWYHPDHCDYFRYTNEAILRIFQQAGGKSIKITPNYCGPFIAAAQMMILSFPRWFRPVIFCIFYALDKVYFLFKKNEGSSRYVLGYLFVVSK